MPVSVCPGCGTPGQLEGARFCFGCGTVLPAPGCVSCGADLPPGSRFCPSCGTPQTSASAAPPAPAAHPVASRRVTSVLFGDLVGFTALSETRDQEDVRELLSSYFESCSQVIARYGGTVEKFIGDAVMAVWGVPTTHEDDAERAVRAGLELVHLITALGTDLGVPDLAMRVGIVTGEVAVTVGAAQQGMVAGDAVNTAARVQAAAAPGQVWVDETTRLLTSSAVTYADVGSHAMKGKADPMPLWAVRAIVAGVGGAQRADGLEAPHVGRDRELRLVKELFHAAEEHRRPALLVVSGEAGVGKSRLGWEFDKYTDGLNTTVRWHTGRCLSYGEGVAFYALAEAIRARLQVVRPDDDGEATEDYALLLTQGLAAYVPDLEERAWMEPRLGALLGTVPAGSYKREDLFSAWTTFLHRVSGDGDPVVLLIDDAQHADDGLLDFVEHLLAVGTFPCFVVLLARPSLLEERPTLATNRRAHVLHLEALSDSDMGAVLDGLVANLPEATRTALVDRAEGIPLYAVETVRSLIDRDLVVPRAGQYVLADATGLDLDAVGAPASLQALIAARLDTLTPQLRRLIDQASVLGNSFSREAIAGLCPDVPDLEGAIAQLVRLQLLSQESSRFSTEVGQYRFVQTAVRQVAYGTLSRRDRKASHLAVVRQLEQVDDPADELAPIIAQHYLEALDAVPEDADRDQLSTRAVGLLQRAATRAAALGAPAEAVGHLRSALGRSTEVVERAGIELDLARHLYAVTDYEPAIEHATAARDAFDQLGDPLSAAAAVATLAQTLPRATGIYEAAIAMTQDRLDTIGDDAEAREVRLQLLRSLIGLKLETNQDFREPCDEQLRLAELLGDDAAVADSFLSLGLHYSRADAQIVARLLMQAAADMAQRNHDPRMRGKVLTNLNALWMADDLQAAVEFGREAQSDVATMGEPYWASVGGINLAMALVLEGAWTEADTLVEAHDQTTELGTYWDLLRCYVAVNRGEPCPLVGGTAEIDGEDLSAVAFGQVSRAVRLLDSDVGAATTSAVEAVHTVYRSAEIVDDFSVVYAVAADVVVRAGARDALAELDSVVDRHDTDSHPRGVRALRAHHRGLAAIWVGAAPETVEQHLRAALTEARTWGSGLVQARVAADLGAWLTEQGRASESVELLELARSQYARMGAVRPLADLDLRLGVVAPTGVAR